MRFDWRFKNEKEFKTATDIFLKTLNQLQQMFNQMDWAVIAKLLIN